MFGCTLRELVRPLFETRSVQSRKLMLGEERDMSRQRGERPENVTGAQLVARVESDFSTP